LTGFNEFKVPSSKFQVQSAFAIPPPLKLCRTGGRAEKSAAQAGAASPPASGLRGVLSGNVLFFTAIQRNLAQFSSVILRARFDRE
jgi:hypothetical protein